MHDHKADVGLKETTAILTDEAAGTPQEVFRHCNTLEELAALGPAAVDALPLIMQSLSRKAVEVLAEMGAIAHDTIPELASRARLNNGPFHYETFNGGDHARSLGRDRSGGKMWPGPPIWRCGPRTNRRAWSSRGSQGCTDCTCPSRNQRSDSCQDGSWPTNILLYLCFCASRIVFSNCDGGAPL